MANLGGRMVMLLRRKEQLEHEIESESARPAPCALALQALKRRRLMLKDAVRQIQRRLTLEAAQ